MKSILVVTVLILGLTTAGCYAYTHINEVGSEYGVPGMMMGGDDHGLSGDCGNNDSGYYHPGTAGFRRNGRTSDQRQKFLDDTVGMRKEMYNKRFEYKEALKNPKNTRQQLSQMEKEMIDLRDKIYDKVPQNQKSRQYLLAEQNEPIVQIH